jgi:hypothetical protein
MERTESASYRRSAHIPPQFILVMLGGGAIALGSWMPWMSYFAGLQPLRGVIGVNGRLLFAAGVVALIAGGVAAWNDERRVRTVARRASGILGVAVAAAAIWLLVGVGELTRIRASNAMLAPRPGFGLVVVLIGGCVLAAAASVRPTGSATNSLSQGRCCRDAPTGARSDPD